MVSISESLIQFLERVLASRLLAPELVDVATRGATDVDFGSAPPLPDDLRELLSWRNGFDLEAVRFHGLGNVDHPILRVPSGAIAFASDPAGFTYLLQGGNVASVDHDGGKEVVIATSVDDFLRGCVFGPRAAEFAGDDWAREVFTAIGSGSLH